MSVLDIALTFMRFWR